MFIRWLAEKNVGQPIRDDEGFLLGELHKEFLGSMGIYLFRRSALFELLLTFKQKRFLPTHLQVPSRGLFSSIHKQNEESKFCLCIDCHFRILLPFRKKKTATRELTWIHSISIQLFVLMDMLPLHLN